MIGIVGVFGPKCSSLLSFLYLCLRGDRKVSGFCSLGFGLSLCRCFEELGVCLCAHLRFGGLKVFFFREVVWVCWKCSFFNDFLRMPLSVIFYFVREHDQRLI